MSNFLSPDIFKKVGGFLDSFQTTSQASPDTSLATTGVASDTATKSALPATNSVAKTAATGSDFTWFFGIGFIVLLGVVWASLKHGGSSRAKRFSK